jgi:hypothetical protein
MPEDYPSAEKIISQFQAAAALGQLATRLEEDASTTREAAEELVPDEHVAPPGRILMLRGRAYGSVGGRREGSFQLQWCDQITNDYEWSEYTYLDVDTFDELPTDHLEAEVVNLEGVTTNELLLIEFTSYSGGQFVDYVFYGRSISASEDGRVWVYSEDRKMRAAFTSDKDIWMDEDEDPRILPEEISD